MSILLCVQNSWAAADSVHVITTQNQGCVGECDGAARVEIFAGLGSGAFRVIWKGDNLPGNEIEDTVLLSDTIFDLCPGEYSVEIIDTSDNVSTGPHFFSILETAPFSALFEITEPTCFDSTNGSISVIPSGGSAPITYAWLGFPNDSNSTLDSVGLGAYQLILIDSNSCVDTLQVVIKKPDPVAVSVLSNDITCRGFCDGEVSAQVSGGTAPYSFAWNNSDTNQSQSGLCQGFYSVVVTDANGCTGNGGATLLDPDTLDVSFTVKPPKCFGDNKASVEAVAIGGRKPYQYQWAGFANNDSTLQNIGAGSFQATVIDASGCYYSEDITIPAAPQIRLNDSIFSSSCGVCDGEIKTFPTGGQGSYHYLWVGQKPADTISSIDSLCAGTYQLVINDDSLCLDTFSLNLSDDTSGIKDLIFTFSKPSCADVCDGALSADVIGGTPPFTYLWSPGSSADSSITGLCAGMYTVEVTDASGCKRIESFTLSSESNLTYSYKDILMGCADDCAYQISVEASGGSGTPTINWPGINQTGAVIQNLCPGKYGFEITDELGCTVSDSAEILARDTLMISVNPLNASCFNTCDGMASINITGGTSPYSVNWSNGSVGMNTMNLCSGNYSVDVTDANGCTKTAVFAITSPAAIEANALVTDALCEVGNGKIVVTPSGGIGNNYDICWSTGQATTPGMPVVTDSLIGLGPNLLSPVYKVEITDSLGCTALDSFVVSVSNGPQLSAILTDESCLGACDGSMTLSSPGNLQPEYTLLLPGGGSVNDGGNSANFAGLCSGTHLVYVLDENSCMAMEEVVINPGKEIIIDIDITDASCSNSCDGLAIATASGGVPPYTFAWSNSVNSKVNDELCAGTYTLTVTDGQGCSSERQLEIKSPDVLTVDLSTNNLTCFDQCDGRISSIVNGGSAPYTYSWSNGSSGSEALNLCAGTYILNVTDANGCVAGDTIALGNGVPLTATFNATSPDCGECNGGLTANISGGNGLPYFYQWSTGDTTNQTNDLTAGIYTLSVTDNSGCSQDFVTTLDNVGGPSINDTVIPTTCFNTCDGIAVVSPSGTPGPYNVQWNDPMLQSTDSAKGLCPDNYIVSVTDSAGCISHGEVEITEPADIQITSLNTDILCPTDSNGTVSISVSGGVPPYDVLWSTGDTLNSIDSLMAGKYWVQVTDTNLCQKSDTFDLLDPTPLSISFDVEQTACFSSCDGYVEATVSGGNSPYSYQWNDPGNQTSKIASDLCAGFVSLTVTDANGCSFTDSVLVTSPSQITLTPILNSPQCDGGNDGSITITPSGGTPPYRYLWNGIAGDSILNNLSAGDYEILVIDSNECIAQANYTLNNPAPLVIALTPTRPGCGLSNGSVAASVTSGGSGSYDFLWNTIPTQTSSTATGLWAGYYEVTVTDNNTGCVNTADIFLSNAGLTPLTFTTSNDSCPGECGAVATVQAGTGNFTYSWNDIRNTKDSTAESLCPGLYQVTVNDTSTGCIRIDTVRIIDSVYSVSILNSRAVDCFGDCNGRAEATVVGGTPPIQFSWNTTPVQTSPVALDLCAGNYIVSVEDSLGCADLAQVIITQPDSLEISIEIIQNALCEGSCDGIARAQITGGSGPFTYLWDGVIGSQIQRDLCPGVHSLEVIDDNNCSTIFDFNISDVNPILDNAIINNQPDCGEYNGQISLNPSGGTGPYFYSWSNGANTSTITDLFAGIYTVEISDINGCSASFTYYLNNVNAPQLNFDKNTVKCNGNCNGVARVTPIGGVAPYTYIWDYVPVSILDSLTGLCSGVYEVKVTDATSCVAFGSDTITEPAILEGTISKMTDGCGGLCEGEAMIMAIGGTSPYSYSWNTTPPQSGSSANGLCEGFATVLITDNNDCTYQDSIEITPPPPLTIDSTEFQDASCFTNSDGQATVYVSGGTTPIRYQWSDNQTTQTAVNLTNGQYLVIVRDTNDCFVTDSFNIGVTDTVLVQSFVDSFTCIGDFTQLVATGQGASVFQWFEDSLGTLKPIGTGDTIDFQVLDSTSIIVRGQNNQSPPCFDLDTNFIIGIQPPDVNAGPDQTIEQGGITSLLASPFLFNGSYAWSPSTGLNDTATIDPVARPEETTTYVVIGTDAFGCFGSDTVTINVIEKRVTFNGLSPNGDGVNDTWELPFLDDYPNVIVEVYNRWGQQVFRSEGYNDPWDGTFEGELLPTGSYYFVIDYNGDGSSVESGAVTILY